MWYEVVFSQEFFGLEKYKKCSYTGVLLHFFMHYKRKITTKNQLLPKTNRRCRERFTTVPPPTRIHNTIPEIIRQFKTFSSKRINEFMKRNGCEPFPMSKFLYVNIYIKNTSGKILRYFIYKLTLSLLINYFLLSLSTSMITQALFSLSKLYTITTSSLLPTPELPSVSALAIV